MGGPVQQFLEAKEKKNKSGSDLMLLEEQKKRKQQHFSVALPDHVVCDVILG